MRSVGRVLSQKVVESEQTEYPFHPAPGVGDVECAAGRARSGM
jgi:hypothetical protein